MSCGGVVETCRKFAEAVAAFYSFVDSENCCVAPSVMPLILENRPVFILRPQVLLSKGLM
jgi:hypothetical protein